MIMKSTICLILFGMTVNCACAQTNPLKHEWKVTLKVVDDNGQPVANARAGIGYFSNHVGASIDGLTDTNGIFRASHSAYSGLLGFAVEKSGYYTTRQEYDLGFTYEPAKWNPTQTIVFKRIINSIPMYAKRLNTHVPALDKPIGFDLMAGDWVTPYGKGIQTDIIFTAHFDKQEENESDFKLTVSFPSHGDGIQEFSVPPTYLPNQGSELRSAQEAPTDGYRSEWIQTDNRKTGRPITTNCDINRNYYFRVRTVLDEQGNVKSALYGKIYGDFMHFSYYLNPTPNSRNVEFDPKRNLSKNLSNMEGVSEP
jgi:hypothetical protein